ncbi:MAG: squalene--hopene cyclase, partial [Acidobacteria bacterium]|nr:squalene--hopene cyclase [Acidobacteriota bacterium]
LTSFVVMSLVAAGEAAHPVVDRGVEFLERSVRADGSWPIDTNLATWATTLSVNALARRRGWRERIGPRGCAALRRWLLDQQYRERHVYTDAAPGGWAWTDLPGGVPDADDTPGALLALHALGAGDAEHREAACAGIGWLVDLQNADGGIPTFCRGWGALPFDRSSPDLTAHTLRAWTVWRSVLPARLRMRTQRATRRAVRFLERAQRADGAWIPLWFGNQGAPDDANPVYGTARVLEGVAALSDAEAPLAAEARAVGWLVGAQGSDGGWGGAPGVPPSIEETAVAVSALATVGRLARRADGPELDAAVDAGARWLIDATGGGRQAAPTPIGLYFAKLWYSETLYPWIFALGAFSSLRPPSR